MRHQRQPNRWSCVPTAFAMVINMDVAEMLDRIGHDGSEILYPDLEEPSCRRSFHPQECLQVLDSCGYAATPLEALPILQMDATHWIELDRRKDFVNHLATADGVFIGEGRKLRHAVAWIGGEVYDPSGIFTLSEFSAQTFWKIKSITK